MYISNIITQAWVYLMIILAKHRTFMGKRDMVSDRPSEMVPEQFFCSYVSVYNMPLDKYEYQPLCPFLAELGQQKPNFCVHVGGTSISIEKVV